MGSSEEQFKELVAQLAVRSTKMLSEQNYLLPFAILLSKSNLIEVLLATIDASDKVQDLVNFIQEQVQVKVESGEFKAICIAYPDYDNGAVVAYLENNENYCSKVTIPVNTASGPVLNLESLIVEDGNVYVFPIVQDG